MYKTSLILLLLLLAAMMAWLLTRPGVPRMNAAAYSAALEAFPGSDDSIETGVRHFGEVYRDLARLDTGERIRDLYARRFHFDDTLKTFNDLDALAGYMQTTAAQLQSSEVRIDHVVTDGPDVYVRWTMKFETRARGMPVRSHTAGMTHLRFDAAGRIVVHQDFWDSAEGLYRHFPLIGWLLRQIDRRMSN